ncbi:MAG: TlyA family RNA methyltransferase [Solirubrobacterales bacterium]
MTSEARTRGKSTKERLDALLVERGLFESRNQAAASVMAGSVIVGDGSRPATKPGTLVAPDAELSVKQGRRYVSRGGLKLERALEVLDVTVQGRSALDVGASTGGFTDCLLRARAERVIALDVAYGELHWSVRRDPRVTVIERFNARELEPSKLPYRPDLVVVDVSFIGLSKILPAIVAAAAERFDLLALIKPQFELGRDRVGKGGVVRDPGDRADALVSVGERARSLGLAVLGYCSSGLPGPAGNRESFVWCAR